MSFDWMHAPAKRACEMSMEEIRARHLEMIKTLEVALEQCEMTNVRLQDEIYQHRRRNGEA